MGKSIKELDKPYGLGSPDLFIIIILFFSIASRFRFRVIWDHLDIIPIHSYTLIYSGVTKEKYF